MRVVSAFLLPANVQHRVQAAVHRLDGLVPGTILRSRLSRQTAFLTPPTRISADIFAHEYSAIRIFPAHPRRPAAILVCPTARSGNLREAYRVESGRIYMRPRRYKVSTSTAPGDLSGGLSREFERS